MGVEAARWLEKYRENYPHYVSAGAEAKRQIEDAMSGRALSIQLISARAKDPDSVAEKIERRGYGRPSLQFDDLIGVRIITLYEHNVEAISQRLRDTFRVDEVRSENKSKELKVRQVGYRSDHLVLKIRKSGLDHTPELIERTFIEVQVRSVVAHAWAEIEHSLRYKIGAGIPSEIARRFDALAGALELVDREFSSIESAIVSVVEEKATLYRGGNQLDDRISTITLLAALAATRTQMKPLGPHRLGLEIEDAFRLAKDLEKIGYTSVGDVQSAIRDPHTVDVVRRYAWETAHGLDPAEASARVVLGAVIGLRDRALFDGLRLLQDPLLVRTLASIFHGVAA